MHSYLVLTLRTSRFDPSAVAPHYAFLDELKARGVLEGFGPFTDRSGGAYILRAESLARAEAIAFADPLHTSGSSQITVREWSFTRTEAPAVPDGPAASAAATVAIESPGHATWADFERVRLRVGTIRKVESFPQARRPAYKLLVDFGSFGLKSSSAQLTTLYTTDDLLGRQVICATGLGPKRVAGFKSEVLVTGFAREDGAIVLAAPERAIPDGSPLC